MAKGVTVDLIVDPKGAIQGLGQVEDKSSHVAGVLGKLGGVAVAGIAALGTAALGAVTGLTAATKSAGEYAENVELAASKTHLSTDAVQELQYASKISGVSFETISGGLTKLTKSLGQAAGGNKTTAAAFATLGVATTDATGNLRASTDVYADVIDALGQVSNPTERDVLAMQILGKTATNLNPLIDGTAGSLTDLSSQAHDAGAVLSGDMLGGLSNVDDAFDKLSAGTDAAKNALGLVLMPALTELGDSGSGLLGQFTNAVVDANGDLSKAAPAILEVGTSIIGALLTGIVTQAPDIITSAVPILLGFVATLIGQLPLLLDAGLKVLVALVQGIALALPTLIPAAVSAVIGLVGALVDNLPLLIDAGLQLLVGLITGLITALPQLIDAIPTLITGIIVALVGAIPQLILAGVKLFLALVTNLPAIIMGIIGAVPAIITGLVKAFGDPKVQKQMMTAGLQLIEGLWEGIKGAADWLWNQLKGFFGGILNQIKDFLGIHSPSTVFADYGRNLVAGLVVGLGAPNDLDKVTSDLSRQVTDGFSTSLGVQARASFSATSGVAYGGGNTYVIQLPIGMPSAAAGKEITAAIEEYERASGR